MMLVIINVKNTSSLKQFVMATRLHRTSKTAEIKCGAITLAAHHHNVNVLLSNSSVLMFTVLVR